MGKADGYQYGSVFRVDKLRNKTLGSTGGQRSSRGVYWHPYSIIQIG